jgi:hypothetical protein
MRESFYINKNNALINFSQRYYSTTNEIVSSDSFNGVILSYIKKVQEDYPNLHSFIVAGKSNEEATEDLVHLVKLLLGFRAGRNRLPLSSTARKTVRSRRGCL